jgi:hypothetical protein
VFEALVAMGTAGEGNTPAVARMARWSSGRGVGRREEERRVLI